MSRKPTQQTLRETVFSPDAKMGEGGVIHNVKVLGLKSKNGREYTPESARNAITLYEGADIFLNHQQKKDRGEDRPVQDKIGWLSGVYQESNGDLHAREFHYLESHPYASQLVETVKRRPEHFGLSHDADGQVVRKSGRATVESINKVFSVDLVARPATTQSIFESEETMPTTVKKLVESLDAKHPHRSRLLEMMGDSMMADAPVEPPAEASADDQVGMAIDAMVMAVLGDDAAYPDNKAKLTKIAEILDAKDMLVGAEKKDPPAGDEGADTETKESKAMKDELNKLRESVVKIETERDQLKTRDACRALLESKSREVTDVRLTALSAVPEASRQSLVESWPAKQQGGRPDRSPPAEELTESYGDYKKKHGGSLATACKR